MYLVLPWAHFLFRVGLFPRRLSLRAQSLVLWGISVVLALVLPWVNWRLQIASFAPCFCAGIVAYAFLRYRPYGERVLPAWVWPLGLLTAVIAFGPMDNVSLFHKLHRAWGLALAVGLLFVHVQELGPGWFSKGCHWLAEHSYGVYLSHIIMF